METPRSSADPPTDTEIRRMIDEKIALGQRLSAALDGHRSVDGVQKIQRKIRQEVKFLQKVSTSGQLKINYVLCSNLVHYASLVRTLQLSRNVKYVDYPVPLADRKPPLRVDIVCDSGRTWTKVIARNPKSLSETARGCSGYGAKTIVDQAEEFVEAAAENMYFFRAPVVQFVFAQRIDDELAGELRATGIRVEHIDELCPADDDGLDLNAIGIVRPPMSSDSNDLEAVARAGTLNLDVTAILAYVSAMTNGSADWEYLEDILTEQAQWERQSPVKRILDSVFDGKKLICCVTAAKSAWDIVRVVGGPGELRRMEEFMVRIVELPDIVDSEEHALKSLQFGGKIKTRSVRIFAFGLAHEALTVTANDGFIRSARMQGVHIPAFVHGARPLSELKEANAKRLRRNDKVQQLDDTDGPMVADVESRTST